MPVPQFVKRVVPWRIRNAIRRAQRRGPPPVHITPSIDIDIAPAVASATWDRHHADGVRSVWTENPTIHSVTNQRQSGDPHRFWLHWLFEDHLKIPVGRVLSIGCGTGEHEHLIAERGWASRIDAFDASPVGIEQAIAEAKRAGHDQLHFSVRSFEDFIAHGPDKPIYDVVVFAGSLHHVKDLEGMLSRVRRVLVRDGAVLLNEYIGPCYTILPDERVALVNRFLDALPAEFKQAPDARFVNPTIEMVMEEDPTEGVRAPLIPELLRLYFDVDLDRRYRGGLLHPIFTRLDGARLADESPESQAIVGLLVQMEDVLTEIGTLDDEFMVGLCRHKRG